MILEAIKELECQKCHHKWLPRKLDVRYCPECQTAYWDTPRDDVNKLAHKKHRLLCLRCGHTWESDNIHPVRCAKCKSPYWDIPRQDVNILDKAK
jgi:Zn finger protein HypA/HybF involved in hydrogenase expression